MSDLDIRHPRPRFARHIAGIATPVLILLTAAASLGAQAPDSPVFDAKSAGHIRNEYLTDMDSLHSKFMALANAIPADKYTWRPGAGVRSVSEVLMHVAGEWFFWGPGAMGGVGAPGYGPTPKEAMPKLQELEKTTAKADVIAALDKSWTHYRSQIVGADPSKMTGKYKPWGVTIDAAAFGMSGDLHEHLGQLIAYARSVDVKPPWSKQ